MAKHNARPLRSVLFVAGHDRNEIVNGYKSGADSIVIDLEEPRAPFPEEERIKARAVVKKFLGNLPKVKKAPLIFSRVQPASTGQTLKDLRAVMGPNLAGVLVPKIESPADVHAVDALLTCMEAEMGLEMGSTMLYPIFETAQALRNAYDIGMASPRVSYMGGAISRFGDIHQAVGFRWTQEGKETLFLRSKVLIDAKACGIKYPISGMWGGRLDDTEGLRVWCTELRNLGYYGMMIGDPLLIPTVHEVFSPTAEELAYWKRLDRLAIKHKPGSGPIIDGDANQGEAHIVHMAHVGSARKNLAWAKELGLA